MKPASWQTSIIPTTLHKYWKSTILSAIVSNWTSLFFIDGCMLYFIFINFTEIIAFNANSADLDQISLRQFSPVMVMRIRICTGCLKI